MSSAMLPLLLILYLLCIGGIEPNPGPVSVCRTCKAEFKSIQNYFDHHQSDHSTEKVPCLNANCDYSSSSRPALQTHLTRCNHKPIQEKVCFQCPVDSCDALNQVTDRHSFKQHLEDHLKNGQCFKCPFDNCVFFHKNQSVFGSHISRHHNAHPTLTPNLPDPSRNIFAASTSNTGASRSTTSPSSSHDNSVYLEQVTDSSLPSGIQSDPSDTSDSDPYPPQVVKDAVLEFYVKLEGEHVLPSSTVQVISENISKFTEMSHHSMKRTLEKELKALDLDIDLISNIMNRTFLSDPVFNMHHKHHDVQQVSSIYLRKKLMKERLPYVSPVEVILGKDESGKLKFAHRVPIKETLETLIKDPEVKDEIVKSFTLVPSEDGVLRDFRDGSAFKEHLKIHKKCIHLILFQDAFEHNPFGPASGKYKTIGMYYIIGNFPPQLRSKVDKILLAFLLQERYLKTSEKEHLNGCNKFAEALKSLIEELKELQVNGVTIDGENIPVCVLFVAGDNLGAHQIGSFVQSFSSEYCCRFCPISMKDFKEEPWKCLPMRTPEQYDEYVLLAHEKWTDLKIKSIDLHQRHKELQAMKGKTVPTTMVSKSALLKLRSIHHLGVKPIPSALNSLPNFHVCNDGFPSCLAHDLYQGIIDTVLIKILKHFIVTKEWITLETLNRRINGFQCKCSDADDAPTSIRNFDGIKGHACETWTFVRLLPFMIEDLIQDKEDEHWKLYLQLKEICEYVCAPQISEQQVAHLDHVIQLYLCNLKELLPDCLTPKNHFLRHYPSLILRFGPLIRLFTMRFESKHVFFKKVQKMCHNFTNPTHTQAEKYMYRFACDQINGLIPPDVVCNVEGKLISVQDLQPDMYSALPPSFNFSQVTAPEEVIFKGTSYQLGMFMVLDKCDVVSLYVGCIEKILLHSDGSVTLCLREYVALNSFQGYFVLDQERRATVQRIDCLPDHYPLPVYLHGGKQCLSLKHSLLFM